MNGKHSDKTLRCNKCEFQTKWIQTLRAHKKKHIELVEENPDDPDEGVRERVNVKDEVNVNEVQRRPFKAEYLEEITDIKEEDIISDEEVDSDEATHEKLLCPITSCVFSVSTNDTRMIENHFKAKHPGSGAQKFIKL